ncbi:hypothetical protein [Tessaracoccus sp.]
MTTTFEGATMPNRPYQELLSAAAGWAEMREHALPDYGLDRELSDHIRAGQRLAEAVHALTSGGPLDTTAFNALTPQDRWALIQNAEKHLAGDAHPVLRVTVPRSPEQATVTDWQAAVSNGQTTASFQDWAQDDGTAPGVTCPYEGCDSDLFAEVDLSIRWNALSDLAFTNGVLYASYDPVEGEHELLGYQCQVCRRPVSLPAGEHVFELVL